MRKPSKKKASKPKKTTSRKVLKPLKRLKKITRKIGRSLMSRRPLAKAVREIFQSPAPVFRAPDNASSDTRLPSLYGEDKLVLLVRDPWWIYAYWEVTPARHGSVESQAHQSGQRDLKTVLRVYDITKKGPDKPDSFFDIELNFFTNNWYIDVGMPDRQWMAELGLRSASGKFFVLVRSNIVRTPSFGLSDVLDEEWMLPEEIYYQIIGLTGPGRQSGGSLDIRHLLEKYLKQVISSERLPQVSPVK